MAEVEHESSVDIAEPTKRGRRQGGRRPANTPPTSAAAVADAHVESESPTVESPASSAPSAPSSSGAASMERPGLFKVLWADIRGRRLPYQPTAEELQWEADEAAAEAAARAGMAAGTDLSDEHYEELRRRLNTKPS